jgi:hypothetical protein
MTGNALTLSAGGTYQVQQKEGPAVSPGPKMRKLLKNSRGTLPTVQVSPNRTNGLLRLRQKERPTRAGRGKGKNDRCYFNSLVDSSGPPAVFDGVVNVMNSFQVE